MIRRTRSSARHGKRKGKNKTALAQIPAQPEGQYRLEGREGILLSSAGPYPPSLWFWNDPPTPDPGFAPFYARATSGDPQALVEFYRRQWRDLGDTFYRTIGYLAAMGNAQEIDAVRKIMNINRRCGPHALSDARRESARHLAQRLLPIAQAASHWISQRRQSDQTHGRFSSREKLWREYVEDKCCRSSVGVAASALLSEFEPQQLTPRTKFRAPKLTRRELRAQKRDKLRFIASMYFSRGMVPRSLFFDLGCSAPRKVSPSIAVRRLAEKIAI